MKRKNSSPQAAEPVRSKRPFFGRPEVILTILVVMIVSAAYLWVRALWIQPQAPLVQPQAPVVTAPTPVLNVVDRVSELIPVPADEQPIVRTISDVGVLRESNPFYKDAENGDKVLFWSDKAVIYSLSKDKIVSIATANPPPTPVLSAADQATSTQITLENVTIEVRNGSGVNGAAAKLKKLLVSEGLSVSLIGDAKTKQESTIVVDQTLGKAPVALSKAAKLSVGTISPLPAGEPVSKADLLIIIGKNSGCATCSQAAL
jgi:hypothetical protein